MLSSFSSAAPRFPAVFLQHRRYQAQQRCALLARAEGCWQHHQGDAKCWRHCISAAAVCVFVCAVTGAWATAFEPPAAATAVCNRLLLSIAGCSVTQLVLVLATMLALCTFVLCTRALCMMCGTTSKLVISWSRYAAAVGMSHRCCYVMLCNHQYVLIWYLDITPSTSRMSVAQRFGMLADSCTLPGQQGPEAQSGPTTWSSRPAVPGRVPAVPGPRAMLKGAATALVRSVCHLSLV